MGALRSGFVCHSDFRAGSFLWKAEDCSRPVPEGAQAGSGNEGVCVLHKSAPQQGPCPFLPAVFLSFFGIASIGLSCLVALFLYHVVFGIQYLGILNGVAAFVIVGIGELPPGHQSSEGLARKWGKAEEA